MIHICQEELQIMALTISVFRVFGVGLFLRWENLCQVNLGNK